ncbi:Myosin-cross-reactive_antigen [Hexamita inflata]|uniref:Putative n=1 Tax=Hexamita inflata TaxID=28002 RepID=A0AA86PNQ0_9EUKA|nr:Myosin-cross-reactive antigen [Hexamita inflata]
MDRKAYFIGGGIGSLAAAFFLIRDAGFQGKNIKVFEELTIAGGSMDGNGSVEKGFLCRGGRMMNAATYECFHNIMKEIPSIQSPGKTVFEELQDFNKVTKTHANSRVVDLNGCRLEVDSMNFNNRDRMQLLALTLASEEEIGNALITDWFSPEFFKTHFWLMWTSTFAFQPWHSVVELKRYNQRFLHMFPNMQTLSDLERTPLNQYDSVIAPMVKYLQEKGVTCEFGCVVEDLAVNESNKRLTAKTIIYKKGGNTLKCEVAPTDLVFIQNGCMTDASTTGGWKKAAPQTGIKDQNSFKVWQSLASKYEHMGNPQPFIRNTAESQWHSFTVTMKNEALFKAFTDYQMNSPGTGALMTFKDSNWLMSLVIAYQPHFVGQNKDTKIMWGYGLFPNKIGNYVKKSMLECTGEEIFYELCQHCRIAPELVHDVVNIPCFMPFITAQFMPRLKTDRPVPHPKNAENFGFISQFVEIPNDVVFTVEYSCRAAQMAVYSLCNIKKQIPNISRYDRKLSVKFRALKKVFRKSNGTQFERKHKKCCGCGLVKLGLVGAVGAGVAFAAKKMLE